MSETPFHKTRMGQVFYERTMPELVRQLELMNDLLERLLLLPRAGLYWAVRRDERRMRKDPHSHRVGAALQKLGYEVVPIPEGHEESADLWAHCGADCLTVEVKSRVDDADVVEELHGKPRDIVTRDTPIARLDALGRIVHKARKQIVASQGEYPGLAVLVFVPDPHLGISAAGEQMESNLLGRRAVSLVRGEEFRFARAYLVTRTDFHKYTDLDAAVVRYREGERLLVNPYSTHKEALRSSRLYRDFVAQGVVTDLDLMESNEDHFILRDERVDRSSEKEVLEALTRQHPDRRFMFSHLHAFKGFVQIDPSELK